MKKRDDVENYIKQMEQCGWKLSSKDDDNLTFEKENSKRKHFKTFMKSGLLINFTTFMLILIYIMNLHDYYNRSFCYTVTNYWKIFMVYFAIIFIVMSIIIFIGKINYLFKYRVNICGEKDEYSITISSFKRRIKNERREAIILIVLLLIGLIVTIGMQSALEKNVSGTNLKITELNNKVEGKIDKGLEIRKTIFAKDILIYQTVYDELKNTYYTDRKEKAYLEVEYFSSDHKWILNKGFKSLYYEMNNYTDFKENNNSEELRNWGAKKLFVGDYDERIVLYEDSVLTVYGDVEYTKENIEKILKACIELTK